MVLDPTTATKLISTLPKLEVQCRSFTFSPSFRHKLSRFNYISKQCLCFNFEQVESSTRSMCWALEFGLAARLKVILCHPIAHVLNVAVWNTLSLQLSTRSKVICPELTTHCPVWVTMNSNNWSTIISCSINQSHLCWHVLVWLATGPTLVVSGTTRTRTFWFGSTRRTTPVSSLWRREETWKRSSIDSAVVWKKWRSTLRRMATDLCGPRDLDTYWRVLPTSELACVQVSLIFHTHIKKFLNIKLYHTMDT